MWCMYQKYLWCCTGKESLHLVKTADAIIVCFAQDWDDRRLCFCLHIVPKMLHLLCHFWSIDSLLTAPLLARAASAIFDGHCCRGYKERNHTAAPATEIECPKTLLIHKKCNCWQKKCLLSQANKAMNWASKCSTIFRRTVSMFKTGLTYKIGTSAVFGKKLWEELYSLKTNIKIFPRFKFGLRTK